jgi:site-specific recombinase XerD
MNVRDAIDGYLLFKSNRVSAETLKTDTVLLRQFVRWLDDGCKVSSITSEDVVGYLDYHRERGLSPYTIKRHYALLSAFWSWLTSPDIALCEEHIVSPVPTPKTPKRVVETLTRDDIEALLDATRGSTQPRRDRALVLFLLDSCARVSEVAGVQLDDMDLTRGRVGVIGKGDNQRYVYLGKRALQSIWLYLKQERPEPMQSDSEHLFLTYDGYPMDRHSIRKTINRLAERAGVDAHPHLFRHTGATERLRRGMDLMSLKHLLGHQKLSTTEKYLSALQDEDTEARAKRTSPGDDWRL